MKIQFVFLAAAAALFIATPVLADAESDLVKACQPDVQKLCKGVQPGGGKILECLKTHENQVSVGCAKAVAKAKAG